MHSSIDGLTLPGMIEEPGCTAGRAISASPVSGPLASGSHTIQITALSVTKIALDGFAVLG